ncbi:chaperone protein EcpD [Pseudomonas cedrina]|uniref:Pilus assembly protein n=2 Tax=Pseudomonas cedrina TaxID=651740 RepID=A0A1V2KC24_PSECE|nr:fimbria/pilus periplasmic chaperone [Pseudomonas cedrina]ONH54421.1 pilus assembly protein [Pseudomonas cedrina subsp. cedrina]SDT62694.1 chaperone protein EcpD [Pseudomonas cedrina]
MNASLVSRLLPKATLVLVALLAATAVQASVVIGSTRIVYLQKDKEVTVRLDSKNQKPTLLQVWLDDGNEHSTPDESGIPFVATPPIFRMEPQQQQIIRLAHTGEPLPAERESLFWFNLLEVPSQALNSEQNNQLQLAFRSRIKLFYRPATLPYDVEEAPAKLQWKYLATEQGQALEVFNPTPYHVSFDTIELVTGGQRHSRETSASGDSNMVVPGGRNRFVLPGLKSAPASALTVEFQTLDDYGVRVSHTADIRR